MRRFAWLAVGDVGWAPEAPAGYKTSIFFTGTGDFEVGVVDGMKCDEHGNIWVTGPGGVWIFDSEGSHLGVLEVPEKNVGNLNWGGNNWSDLYICASTSLYRIHLRVAGNRSSYMG